ncbi:MAG: hypothetical protein OXU81_08315, partial [Gammaproteobacteria bacterium]|nr:hypothetical protein [Gammaproteobacteria bacterium]
MVLPFIAFREINQRGNALCEMVYDGIVTYCNFRRPYGVSSNCRVRCAICQVCKALDVVLMCDAEIYNFPVLDPNSSFGVQADEVLRRIQR